MRSAWLQWALSPRDCQLHLLAPGDHPWGVRTARCGHLLPPELTCQHGRGRRGAHRTCPRCAVIAHRPPKVPGERWASHQDTPALPPRAGKAVVRALWGRCPVDGLLHLLTRTAVCQLAAQGRAPAWCGVLLTTENLMLRGSGIPCLSCLVGSASRDPAAG